MATTRSSSSVVVVPQMLLRSRQGLQIYSEGGQNPASLPEVVASAGHDVVDSTQWSADGELLAVSMTTGVHILRHDAASGNFVECCQLEPCKAMHFSPKGTYLLTWRNAAKGGGGEDSNDPGMPNNNLVVWNTATGEAVLRLPQKVFRSAQWPSVQWSADESLAMRAMPGSIQIYSSDLTTGVVSRIPIPDLASFSIARGPPPFRLAAFVPEKKGKPGRISVYQYPGADSALASKSSYKAQEADFKWSPDGKAVISLVSTDVDATGQSYYGSTGLFLLHSDGSLDTAILPPKEGPVHDVQWGPSGRQFAVCAGTMPSRTILYNFKGEPTFEFGAAHRNTLSWSPHGRFLCVAGFGNLRGDADFWDCNKLKLMGSTQTHCAIRFGWSPDSRRFSTATCAPRMNVDNGIFLYRYNGDGPLEEVPFEQLFDATWRPAPAGLYPDRPMSPGRKSTAPAANAPQAAAPAAAPAGAYRPPGARQSGSSVSAMMRAEREGTVVGPGKVTRADAAWAAPGGTYIPGLAAPEGPSKSQKRKEKKKKSEAEAQARKEAEEALAEAAAAAPVDPEKRKKQLVKKLKQIEGIREKQAGGATLNEDQLEKLEAEAALRAELATLG